MEIEMKDFCKHFYNIESEIKKSIIGQKDIVRDVLVSIIIGGNVLLEGLPGLGKTQMVKAFSKALDLKFSRIQFTPDLMPSDITGTDIFVKNENFNGFQFQQGPIFSNFVLADEINRATPKTQSSLLEAMQEKCVTVGTSTYVLPEPFFVLATQNPIESEGTYPLPEAQLDRFLMKLLVTFPNKQELSDIVKLTTSNDFVEVNKICDASTLNTLSKLAKDVPIATSVYEYAMEIAMKTHKEYENSSEEIKKYTIYGSSPRGAQALVNVSKIYALIDERFNVSYEDVKKASFPVLRHRLFLSFEALSENITADDIINTIL